MTILAFRHAPVALAGICYGQLDVETSLSAEDAAAIIAGQLAGIRPARIWSSPLARCAGPARALAARLGAPHVVDARLLEIAYGAWEGRAWTTLERDDEAAYHAWMSAWKTSGPPGGESALDVEARVRDWWGALDGDGVEALIAHAGVMRALAVITRSMSWEEAMATTLGHLEGERFPNAPVRPCV